MIFEHGYTLETRKVLRAMATIPVTARRQNYDALIRSLKTAGVWAKLDALYLLWAHEQAAALINVKNPGTFTATLSGTPSFTTDQGFTGDGTDDVFNSNFNPTTAGGNFVLNSAHVGVWVATDVAEDRLVCGPSSTSGAQQLAQINPRTAANLFSARCNDSTSFTVSSGSSIGHWGANRSGASAREFYKDGASIGSDSVAATSINNTGICALKGGSQFSTRRVTALHVGSSLTGTEWSNLYTALNAYLGGL